MLGAPIITLDTRALDLQARMIKDAGRRFEDELQSVVLPLSQRRADGTINREPRRFVGKRDWESEAQRRYVMAKLRRENNLPYRRTGKVRSWEVVLRLLAIGGEIAIENGVAYAKYVFQPPFQQRMHRQPPWMSTEEYRNAEIPPLLGDVLAAWYRVNEV